MEIKLIHILGPVLATVAMLFYGRAMVGRARGRTVRVGPALLLIAGAILFRLLSGNGTFLDRICLILMDFGIALILDSGYLAVHRQHPKVFWVPGVLALVVSFGLYFLASLFGLTVKSMFSLWEKPAQFTQAEVLLELGPDDDIAELGDLMEKYDAAWAPLFPDVDVKEDEDLAKYYMVDLPEGKAEAFLADAGMDKENVDAAELNGTVDLVEPKVEAVIAPTAGQAYLANDPGIAHQWWLTPDMANAAHAYLQELRPARKAKVAIVDTGVDGGHEDLNTIFQESPGIGDEHGHGTHCAGLAGAATHNGKGMASFNWQGRFLTVAAYKALDGKGHGDHVSVAKAIQAAAKDGADVISMSLGMPGPAPKVIREAADYAQKRGCILVAAAGNSYGEDASNHAPANVPGVIVVSALNAEGRRAEFSNVNTRLKFPIAAPGQEIYSTLPNGEYAEMSGTSMATPIVAGVIGVMRSLDPDLTAEQAWRILHETGDISADVKEVGRSVNALKAIGMVD